MKISREYEAKAPNFQSIRLVIEKLKEMAYYVSEEFSSYALTYEEERIETSDLHEFLGVWEKRGYTHRFYITLSLGPKDQSKRLGWVSISGPYMPRGFL